MILTLITTNTSSNAASSEFSSGITSAYDEYMFVVTDCSPTSDGAQLEFQVDAVSQSGYNEVIHTCSFDAFHLETGGDAGVQYRTTQDNQNSTADTPLLRNPGGGSDENAGGIFHLFSPADTTYVKHFYWRASHYYNTNAAYSQFVAGYVNTTSAIDSIRFKPISGNLDAVIQMYGVA